MGLVIGGCQEKLSQALPIEGLISKNNIIEIEKYYKQLPKDLREEWVNANTFSKLFDHLKMKFPEDKIYNIGEDFNFDCQELDDFNVDDDWVVLSGNNEDS